MYDTIEEMKDESLEYCHADIDCDRGYSRKVQILMSPTSVYMLARVIIYILWILLLTVWGIYSVAS